MAKNSIKQDENINYRSNRELLINLFSYLTPYKIKVIFVLFLMILVMICSLLNPYLLQIAIDKYIYHKNLIGLFTIASVMLFINILSMFASKLSITIMASVTNKILLTIRQKLYTHIQKLSFSFFDDRPVGKILARVIGDVNSLNDLFSNGVTNFIPQILTLICVTFIMFYMNFKLALVAVLIIPILFLGLFCIETFSRKRWQKFRQKKSNMNAYTHEDFSGIKVIQAFTAEDKTSKSFLNIVNETISAFLKAVRLNDLFWPIIEISSGIGTMLVYWYSLKLIQAGSLSIGTLVAFTVYINMFWRPIMNISDYYNTLITNFAAAERIFEIFDINPLISNNISSKTMPEIKGSVEFKNVHFGYEKKYSVLNDVSFNINPGENVALVGPTGAGKSTIINLISRFYDCDSGSVSIDDINVKNVTLDSLRCQMGIMLQDTFLFSTTIKENIRYGKLDATDEEIIAAAKAVNAHSFIMNLKKGYDTKVNERGSRLSVGQRQLISFARALLANPRILILDEATSNIDTVTEQLVQQGIKKLLAGRTSFVIAHRLSTIIDCDKIMVVNNGSIIECGTHTELMRIKGFYYSLYKSQYKFLSNDA